MCSDYLYFCFVFCDESVYVDAKADIWKTVAGYFTRVPLQGDIIWPTAQNLFYVSYAIEGTTLIFEWRQDA